MQSSVRRWKCTGNWVTDFLNGYTQEALAIEFESRKVPFGREVEVPVKYKGSRLNCGYYADFVCYGDVVVELKVASVIDKTHVSQLINYLKATGFHRGLLLNFGSTSLEYRRLVN